LSLRSRHWILELGKSGHKGCSATERWILCLFSLYNGHGAQPDHKRQPWGFLPQVFYWKKDIVAFYKRQQGWQNELMNVLLDKQDWGNHQLLPVVTSLPRLRMPEMPTPGQHIIRTTGVPGNWQSFGLCQATLTQPVWSSPPVAAAAPKRKNRTATAESDDYTDLLLEDPITRMGSQHPKKTKNLLGCLNLLRLRILWWKVCRSVEEIFKFPCLFHNLPSLCHNLLHNLQQKRDVLGDQGKMLLPTPILNQGQEIDHVNHWSIISSQLPSLHQLWSMCQCREKSCDLYQKIIWINNLLSQTGYAIENIVVILHSLMQDDWVQRNPPAW